MFIENNERSGFPIFQLNSNYYTTKISNCGYRLHIFIIFIGIIKYAVSTQLYLINNHKIPLFFLNYMKGN